MTLTPMLSTLLRWEIADSSTTVATKTSTQHLQTMGRPRVVIPSFVSRETDQVVLSCAMEATTNYGDWFPQSVFDNAGVDVDLAVVTRLTREGVLQSRVSDKFGNEECSLVWSQLEFKMSHKLGGAELVKEHARQVSDWSAVAKLEVMGILLRIEWCDGATAPVRADYRPKRFCLPALSKGKHYWIALLRHEYLFDRGVAEIPHGPPNNFYRCLLELPQDIFCVKRKYTHIYMYTYIHIHIYT